jgi:hypothetical protein
MFFLMSDHLSSADNVLQSPCAQGTYFLPPYTLHLFVVVVIVLVDFSQEMQPNMPLHQALVRGYKNSVL